MKYKLYLISALLCFFCKTGFCENKTDNVTTDQTLVPEENTLTIKYSPELGNLITKWSKEYNSLNPTLNISIDKILDKRNIEGKNICFISDECPDDLLQSSEWRIIVGHDVIVPVINAKNPLANEIYQLGISAKKFALLFNSTKEMNWATLTGGVQDNPLHYYMYDNTSVSADIAKFLKTNPELINGIKVANSEKLISAVQGDLYAVGFCKLKDICKVNTNEWIENIKPLPIDKNENGRIDNFENIYNTPGAFARGVWIGKYPSTLCGNIYAISAKKPTDENTLQFLTWILSEGEQFLNANGYSVLGSAEKQANINILTNNDSTLAQDDSKETSNIWIFILSGLVVAGLILAYILRKHTAAKSISTSGNIHFAPVLNENTIEAPKGLYYDKTHTWTFIEKEGMVKIGIDDFLQHITGTITRIIMKEPGETIRKGEKILTVTRLGKQLNIYSPITGIIKEQNPQLLLNSQFLNTSPYTEGWVYLVEPTNWLRETQFMFMFDTYKKWLKDEFIRLKDFFSTTVRSNTSAYEQIILQDGGELHDNIMADMKPEVWEDFQNKFIDTSK